MSHLRSRVLFPTLAVATVFASLTAIPTRARGERGETEKPTTPAALKAWDGVFAVLTSPRCRNCHPVGDAPLNGNLGLPHAMNVSRLSPDAGLPCTTCHRNENGRDIGSPPGVPGWHMPPREHPMVFERRTSRELCLQIQNPKENGGKSLEALVEHMATDPIVLWGWNPGPGRSRPPISHDEFVAKTKTWVAGGAPCPSR